MAFGDELKKIRLHTGLTQKEVSEKLGMTHSGYSKYERGERKPDFGTLVKIANLFETTIPFLFKDSDNIYTQKDITTPIYEYLNDRRRIYTKLNDYKEGRTENVVHDVGELIYMLEYWRDEINKDIKKVKLDYYEICNEKWED